MSEPDRILVEDLGGGQSSPIDTEELALIRRAQMRDEAAFTVLWKRYEARVTAWVSLHLHHSPDVPEVVNDVAMKMWTSINTFRCESKLSTWLWRVAWHRSLDHIRDTDTVADPVDDNSGAEEWSRWRENIESAIATAREILAASKREHQEIIRLTINEQKSKQDIADRLNVTLDHVGYVLRVFADKVLREIERRARC